MADLSTHLRSRGLTLEAIAVEVDPIMEDAEMLEKAAALWHENQSIITQVIQARVNAIGNHLLNKAIPEEVPVLRQSLVEISALLDDFNKYHGEVVRRKDESGNQEEQQEQADSTPGASEEEPSSL